MNLITRIKAAISFILDHLNLKNKGSLLPTCRRAQAPESNQLLPEEEEMSWEYTYGSLDGLAPSSEATLQIKDSLLGALVLDLGDMSFLEDDEEVVYSVNDIEIGVEEWLLVTPYT